MKRLTSLLFLFLSTRLFSQTLDSNVEFVGDKIQVLQAKEGADQVTGKLSTGEVIKTGCDKSGCYFRIEYKGRTIEKIVGSNIIKMTIYEYDFGGDGDKEIVVVNDSKNMEDSKKTSFIFIYFYSKGIIQKFFEKEILYQRTVLKKDYIEYYTQSGLDLVWNYFHGQFWEMNQVDQAKFRFK